MAYLCIWINSALCLSRKETKTDAKHKPQTTTFADQAGRPAACNIARGPISGLIGPGSIFPKNNFPDLALSVFLETEFRKQIFSTQIFQKSFADESLKIKTKQKFSEKKFLSKTLFTKNIFNHENEKHLHALSVRPAKYFRRLQYFFKSSGRDKRLQTVRGCNNFCAKRK